MEPVEQRALGILKHEQLLKLSKEELIKKIRHLEDLYQKLRGDTTVRTQTNKRPKRKFQFNRFKQRHIALRIAYLGWNMQGFAIQDSNVNTVEGHLFEALKKTCLVQDIKTANYSRCGRTDKGVSAFGQVISLNVRSKALQRGGYVDMVEEESLYAQDLPTPSEELPYTRMLNKTLPPEIRVRAWTPVKDDFSARFSCRSRTYKYFFPRANLDIEKMKCGASKLIGEHDFRNFCKVDSGNNVTHFIRRILTFDIGPCHIDRAAFSDLFEMQICGMAFLWHQVRCMASVLLHIGLGLEEPEVIDNLLDIEKCPRRPQYTIASDYPLILYDCVFDDLSWIYDEGETSHNECLMRRLSTEHAVRTAMLDSVVEGLDARIENNKKMESSCNEAVLALLPGHRKNYKPIMEQPVCEGIERHLQKQALKRQRFEENVTLKKRLMEETQSNGREEMDT